MFILSIIAFIPSIAPDDSLLGFGISFFFSGLVNASGIVINEFIMYSFQVDKVLNTSKKGDRFE